MSVLKLRILPEKTQGHTIFYVEEWPVALIVSAKLSEALTTAGMTGFKLTPVA